MQRAFEWLGRVSWALAALAKLALLALVIIVVSDVVLRNFGARPLRWAISGAEYILLYTTFLALPWLVRRKGHVFVEFLRLAMPSAARVVLAKLVYLTCAGLCVYLGAFAWDALWHAWQSGAYESRTFDMPQWLIYLPIVLGFGLGALEWLRFLLGLDDLYGQRNAPAEGL